MAFILLLSIVFSSCTKVEPVLSDAVEEPEFIEEKRNLALPMGYDKLSEAELDAYFSNLGSEELQTLEDNYQIKAYLIHINKLDLVNRDLTHGSNYSEIDLSTYLTEREQTALTDFVPALETSRCKYMVNCYKNRWWCPWNVPYIQIWKYCGGGYFGVCSNGCTP